MENVIEISHLNKSFREVHAVADLSFRVKKGSCLPFGGERRRKIHHHIDYVRAACQRQRSGGDLRPGAGGTYAGDYQGAGCGVPELSPGWSPDGAGQPAKPGCPVWRDGKAFRQRLGELAELLELQELLGRTVKQLSGGQRRRIDIARALLHRPHILILDEPTTGLDPQTRSLMWQVVARLRQEEGMTVFLTTHYMEEAADADYVVILDSGRIAAEGTPLQLKNTYTGDFLTIYGAPEQQIRSLGLPYTAVRDAFRIAVPNTRAATDLIVRNPELFQDYEITKGRMDDVFLAVTGKNLLGGMAQ